MTSYPTNMQPSGFPMAPQGRVPARRNFTKTAGGLVAAVALAAGGVGFFGLRNGPEPRPTAITQSTAWNSTSDNWSGYAETTAQTGQSYKSAEAEWVVPPASTQASGRVGCAALWTGIGGATSKDLIQLGTSSCSNSSQTGYYAWYEILPAANVPVNIRVVPGDKVLAGLRLVSGAPANESVSQQQQTADYDNVVQTIHQYDPSFPTTHVIERLRQLLAEGESSLAQQPWFHEVVAKLRALFHPQAPVSNSGQRWELYFKVTAPNGTVQNWTKTLSYDSSLSSVEWITEAPTSQGGVEPLPNYGVAHFLGAAANNNIPTLSAENQIVLADPYGEASVPSTPAGQYDSFNTCYFPTHTVTACQAP